jgi:hypothetical protein
MEEETWTLTGDDLFSVGFHLNALDKIRWMSGLVEIHDVVWLEEQDALIFLVTNKDKTGVLFSDEGRLLGAPLHRARESGQPIDVVRRDDEIEFQVGGN